MIYFMMLTESIILQTNMAKQKELCYSSCQVEQWSCFVEKEKNGIDPDMSYYFFVSVLTYILHATSEPQINLLLSGLYNVVWGLEKT